MTELLLQTLVEIERHVADSGWDQTPLLFALARTSDLVVREPAFAAQLGIGPEELPDDALTPVEQDALPDGPLDESLAQIAWPDEVAGCALVQEVVMLPPEAEVGVFADFAGVWHTPNTFVLDFLSLIAPGQLTQEAGDGAVVGLSAGARRHGPHLTPWL